MMPNLFRLSIIKPCTYIILGTACRLIHLVILIWSFEGHSYEPSAHATYMYFESVHIPCLSACGCGSEFTCTPCRRPFPTLQKVFDVCPLILAYIVTISKVSGIFLNFAMSIKN